MKKPNARLDAWADAQKRFRLTVPTTTSLSSSHCQRENKWRRMAR